MAGITIPDRDGDEPEDFRRQQAAIAKQIDEAIVRKVDDAVKRILNKEGK